MPAALRRPRQEQVRGLEVPVHDARGVRRREPRRGLQREVDRDLRGQAAEGEPRLERLPLEALERDVRRPLRVGASAEHLDDVRVLEAQGRLAREPLHGLVARERGAQHLDGGALSVFVDALVDDAHAAAAELLQDGERPHATPRRLRVAVTLGHRLDLARRGVVRVRAGVSDGVGHGVARPTIA